MRDQPKRNALAIDCEPIYNIDDREVNNFNDTPSFTTTEKNTAGLGGDEYNQDDFTLLTLSPEKQKYESRMALM